MLARHKILWWLLLDADTYMVHSSACRQPPNAALLHSLAVPGMALQHD